VKIIGADNFDRDNVDDKLICENLTDWMANFITIALNEKYCKGDGALTYYKAVPNDYKLRKFEP